MHYGLYLPTRGELALPHNLATICARAEALGFRSAMMSDHVVTPTEIRSRYPYTVSGVTPSAVDSLDVLALMSFVAAKTSTLRLVSSVMILPYRNPVLTAKMVATIDVLSAGRVTLGVGVGWMREEFEALGSPDFDRRGAASEEYLDIMKKLWTGEPVAHAGAFYHFDEVRCLPAPVQRPHPPIWIGGNSMAALRRAARMGDGWHPVGANPATPLGLDELASLIATLHRIARESGRDPAAIAITYKAPAARPGGAASSDPARLLFAGSDAQSIEDAGRLAKLGVSEIVFDVRAATLEETLARMDGFGRIIRETASPSGS